MKDRKHLYWELFSSTFKISACTFGGGYVIVPLMRKRFVEELGWMDEGEMLDLVSVSQTAPGPIAVNASLMIGYRMAGIFGALVTTAGTVLPPLCIISAISFFYRQFRDNAYVSAAMRGMQAGVAAVLCNVVADMGRDVAKDNAPFTLPVTLGVFAAVYFWKVNILWVILACGLLGLAHGALEKHRGHMGFKKPSIKGRNG